jgi:hypothetical protein
MTAVLAAGLWLVGQASGPYEVERRVGKDRLDLRLSPSVEMSRWGEERSLGVSARVDARMICGLYDLKATFKHLLGKEAREEFLEDLPELLVGEIVGSGMDLLCQAEPTICTLLQNYSVSANLKVGYYADLCRAVEGALVDAQRKSYAGAVEVCLREKQAQGYPLDRALEACGKASRGVSGFRGEVVGELDLGSALRGALREAGLSAGAQELAGRLGEETRMGREGVSARPDAGAVAGLYEKLRRQKQEELARLVERARAGEALGRGALAAVLPEGAPPVTEDEVRGISLLGPSERGAVVASLASAWALYEMTRRIHEVERALEALKGGPALDEGKRELLEERLVRLRNEKRRLGELYEEDARVMGAVAAAKGAAAAALADRRAGVGARADLGARKRALAAGARPWGELPPRVEEELCSSAASGRGVGSCGGCGLEYGFGAGSSR